MTACPIDHAAAMASPDWQSWTLLGIQHIPADDDGPEENLELRNCPICGTTFSKEIAEGGQ